MKDNYKIVSGRCFRGIPEEGKVIIEDDSSVSIAVPEDLPVGQEVYGTVIMMILTWVGPGYCMLVS